MKKVRFTKSFDKHFKVRVSNNENLKRRFDDRFQDFIAGRPGHPLDDHPLGGVLKGKRAFSITGDIRVVYEIDGDCCVFLDIGTHNQVYR